jgi:hypothetical protein
MTGIPVSNTDDCKRGLRAIILSAFFLVISVDNLSASEIKVRCGDTLISIDTSANTVDMLVNGSDNIKFADNNDYSYTKELDKSYQGAADCVIAVAQYVRITPYKIEFGAHGTNKNTCGTHVIGFLGWCEVGKCKINDDFVLDRLTGEANLNGERVQCEKYTGSGRF